MTHLQATARSDARADRIGMERSQQAIGHGPNGGPPYSRRVAMTIGGTRHLTETGRFPTDDAASRAATELIDAFAHAFGNRRR